MTTEFDHIDRAFEQFYKLVDLVITINNSLVIQKYLQVKSKNQIALETSISKGKVHYLIIDWKNKMSISDIEEIRNFTILIRKSNMSIEQCAQGLRMINILKNLGIHENDEPFDASDDNNIRSSQYNEFSTFIHDIYLTCKNLGVTPVNIFSWITDLFDFHPDTNSTDVNNSSSSLIEKDNVFDKKPIIHDSLQTVNKSSYETDASIYYDNYNSNLKLNDDLAEQIEIPFTSEILYYVPRKKREYHDLENYLKNLKDDISKLEVQKNTVVENLNQIAKKERFAISYLDFFNKLKKELLEN
jgi:hypothetical protein